MGENTVTPVVMLQCGSLSVQLYPDSRRKMTSAWAFWRGSTWTGPSLGGVLPVWEVRDRISRLRKQPLWEHRDRKASPKFVEPKRFCVAKAQAGAGVGGMRWKRQMCDSLWTNLFYTLRTWDFIFQEMGSHHRVLKRTKMGPHLHLRKMALECVYVGSTF